MPYPGEQQNFVSTRMSLPLFMLSRNKIRNDHMDVARDHFQKVGTHYNSMCIRENRGEAASAATYSHNRHISGYDSLREHTFPAKRILKTKRNEVISHDWQLAPNRYGVPPVPFESRAGSKGAVFAKLHTTKTLKPVKRNPYNFYDIKTDIQRLFDRENRNKGVFLTNARSRRATSRLMVSDPSICWRNPTEPSATTYSNKYYDLSYNALPKTVTERPNPHLFLRQSCVPTKPSSFVKKNVSFEPGPGRYSIGSSNTCPCPKGKIRMPGLQLKIENQKRLKFRRLPYKNINPKRYFNPDWRHVKGQGHTFLFRINKNLPKPSKKKTKKPDKQLHMFADAKYMNLINNPSRTPFSVREFPLSDYVPRIRYNCTARRIPRKQLRNNKKIAFNSGQDRFRDMPRPMQLTMRQLNEIIARLPEERRLVDRPLEIRKSKIFSKLHEIPDHMKSAYMPKLRKRLFKFLPMPAVRVLVTEADIRPDVPFDPENPTGLYRKKLDRTKFFLDSVLNNMAKPQETEKVTVDVEPVLSSKSDSSNTQLRRKTTTTQPVAEAAEHDADDAEAES